MSHLDKQKDYWQPCRPGAIKTALELRAQQRRRKFLVRSAMGAVVAGTGIFSAVFIASQRDRKQFAGGDIPSSDSPTQDSVELLAIRHTLGEPLTCHQIAEAVELFVSVSSKPDQARTDLERQLVVRFDEHLQVCQHCPPKVDAALRNS